MLVSRLIGLLALAIAGWLGFSAAALADEVAVPPLTGAIVDRTGTLSPQDLQTVDADLRAFAERRGSQIAVLLVPSSKPETVEQYSLRVAEAWKIGRKKVDDGVILVIAKDDRALRIEVGYGLEGAIPDAIAKRVISETIAPRFRSGDFAGGIRDGTATLMKLIEGEKLPPPSFAPPQTNSPDVSDLLVPLIFAVVIGGVLMKMFGKVKGAAMAGAGFGAVAWWILGSLLFALLGAIVGFVIALMTGGSRGGIFGGGFGGMGGGGGSWGGGSSGGGFSGGGGSFGGGGASGDW